MIIGVAGCLVCLVVAAALTAAFASPIPAVPNKAALRVAVVAL